MPPQRSGNVEWRGDVLEKDIQRATLRALFAMGAVLESQIRRNLNRPGTPTSATGRTSLRLGLSILKKIGLDPVQRALGRKSSKRSRDAIVKAEAIERAGGTLVDPPGGMPRRRTGDLLRSVQSERDGDGVITGAGQAYAAIHEFGGMAGPGRKIPIPARPYIRPSVNQAASDMLKAFEVEMAAALAEVKK